MSAVQTGRAPTRDDFAALLEESYGDNEAFEGTVVKGKVVAIEKDVAVIDIGLKTEGRVALKEFTGHGRDPAPGVGDTVEVYLERVENALGEAVISRDKARREESWVKLEKAFEANEKVDGVIFNQVKGGFTVDLDGAVAFLPRSQVDIRPIRDVTPLMGVSQPFQILKMDRRRGNIVVSRRAVLEETRAEQRTGLIQSLHEGQIIDGVVKNITDYGAFVDLGGVDGLVHVSELSWKHIEHASEVVEVGQEVTVEILEVDLDRERVSLSLKATQEDPWQVFARTHAIGQVAPGKVTKLVPFGAFVRVADGIEGLVHISELSGKHVELAEQVVSVGEEVFVKIIDIDLERRRISLSLKQANESVDPNGTEFDPALYGMATEYDENGEYKYPEGFDPESGAWLEGFDAQREKWEQEYAAAQARWEQHKAAVAKALEAEAAAPVETGASSFSSETVGGGTLADDEALAALREKLSGR